MRSKGIPAMFVRFLSFPPNLFYAIADAMRPHLAPYDRECMSLLQVSGAWITWMSLRSCCGACRSAVSRCASSSRTLPSSHLCCRVLAG